MEDKLAGLGESLGKIMWGALLARNGFAEADRREAEAENNAQRAALSLALRDRDIMNAIAASRQSRVPTIVGAGVPASASMFSDFPLDSVASSGPMMLQGDDVPLGTPGMIRVASALDGVARLMAQQDVELYKSAAVWPAFKSFAETMKNKVLGVAKNIGGATSRVAPHPSVTKAQAPLAPRVEAPKTQVATAKMDAPQASAPAPAPAAKVEPPTPPPTVEAPQPAEAKPKSGLSTRTKLMVGAGAAAAGLGLYTGVKKGLGVLGHEAHEQMPMQWGTPAGVAPAAVNQYGVPQY